jgi:hypothetical protein
MLNKDCMDNCRGGMTESRMPHTSISFNSKHGLVNPSFIEGSRSRVDGVEATITLAFQQG